MKRVRKYIGSYFVELNGDLDALVFTAGVGEGDELFRSLVTEGLLSLGIDVDPPQRLQPATVKVCNLFCTTVMVVSTREELSIGEQSLEVVGLSSSESPGGRGVHSATARPKPNCGLCAW